MKHRRRKTTFIKPLQVWGWIIVVMVILAVTGFVVFQQAQRSAAPATAEVSVDQAAQMRDQGAFFLDVREPGEWTQAHIPGAILIPLGDLPNRVSEVPKDRQVVLVCRTGIRSAQGRDILLKAGFTKVTSMAGGMAQWQAKGMIVSSGN